MKKIFAFLLTLTMLFALGVTALAADHPTKGTITVENATIGQTYTIYKVFDATLDQDNNPTSISYTFPAGSTWNDSVKLFSKDAYGYITISDDAKNGAGQLTAAAIEELAKLKPNDPFDEITPTEASPAVVFTDLDFGYYYVESTLPDLGITTGVTRAVTVTSTMPTATIIDKNQGPSWYDPETPDPADPTGVQVQELGKFIVLEDGRKVTENSANYGDTVDFEISFNATKYYGPNKVATYYFFDDLDTGFTYKAGSLKVYLDGRQTSEYTKLSGFGNNHLLLKLPWKDKGYGANTVVTVKYSATVNNKAVLAGDGNLNKAYFGFHLVGEESLADPTPGAAKVADRPSDEKITTTYVFAIGLTKVDGAQNKTLRGAKFSVTLDGEPVTAVQDGAGVYSYSEKGTVTDFETDNNGMLVIKGLKEGNYSVTETKAPNGYNRLDEPETISVLVDAVNTYGTKYSGYYANNEFLTTKPVGTSTELSVTYPVNVSAAFVANQQGVKLPVTGGMGTTLFYILGGVLVFGAAVLLITKKRMKSEK